MAQELPLSRGNVALVDDADFPLLSESHWFYHPERRGARGYAVRHVRIDGKRKNQYLQRFLMNPPPGAEVIFLNYDGLDCRRENLRVVAKNEARSHYRAHRARMPRVQGVVYNREYDTWSAYIRRNGRFCRVGTYELKFLAERAYEEARLTRGRHE